MSNIRYTTDDQWFRSESGTGLLAGSPLTYFTVTDAGSKILDAIENKEALPAQHAALTNRLLAVGAIHPTYDTPADPAELTVVIPAFIQDAKTLERLQTLVNSLLGPRIIVVDDCSPTEFSIDGAEVIRLAENAGPAAARNAGLNITSSTFIAFVDDDTVVTSEQLCTLAAHLSDATVAAVAPRVSSCPGDSRIAEYETLHSPLDLGNNPAVVRPLSRVSYVPAAVLVARTSVIKEMHSFDSSMRLGEDVDLIWRLVEAGHIVRYDPSVVCHHNPRSTFGAFMHSVTITREHCDADSCHRPLDRFHLFHCRTAALHGRMVRLHVASHGAPVQHACQVGSHRMVFYRPTSGICDHACLVASRVADRSIFTSHRSSLCL